MLGMVPGQSLDSCTAKTMERPCLKKLWRMEVGGLDID